MKIYFVFNNTQWESSNQKINDVCQFFSPDFAIIPTILHTTFTNIPFVKVSTTNGLTNTLGSSNTVDPNWYTQHITSLCPEADIIVFYLPKSDIATTLVSIGIEQGKINGVVQTCLFGIAENDSTYVLMNGVETKIGNSYEIFAEHEIAHALYLLQNKHDNTHLYFYTGVPTGVLTDLKMNKISIWAKSIEKWEGSKPWLSNPGNLKYSSLTASWGATRGILAQDGGYIAKFGTYQQGFTALCNFLTLGCEDELKAFHQSRTLEQFTKVYAGNPPQTYIQGIADLIGCQLSTDIKTFL